jgi:N6-adenosine-specific RNA methylase IME4
MSKFRVIVADPPWKVSTGRTLGRYEMKDGKQLFGVTDNTARKLAYPHMTVAQISALPVSQVAAADAHLYLWTINRYLREAFDVMAAWGFSYSTTLVWAKKPMGGGLGGCYGLATEFVLFGRRGTHRATSRIGRNWFDWKRPYFNGYPKHSAKPAEFYEMVQQVSSGPYLEMFARSERPGWSVWGNEVESEVKLAPAGLIQYTDESLLN